MNACIIYHSAYENNALSVYCYMYRYRTTMVRLGLERTSSSRTKRDRSSWNFGVTAQTRFKTYLLGRWCKSRRLPPVSTGMHSRLLQPKKPAWRLMHIMLLNSYKIKPPSLASHTAYYKLPLSSDDRQMSTLTSTVYTYIKHGHSCRDTVGQFTNR